MIRITIFCLANIFSLSSCLTSAYGQSPVAFVASPPPPKLKERLSDIERRLEVIEQRLGIKQVPFQMQTGVQYVPAQYTTGVQYVVPATVEQQSATSILAGCANGRCSYSSSSSQNSSSSTGRWEPFGGIFRAK